MSDLDDDDLPEEVAAIFDACERLADDEQYEEILRLLDQGLARFPACVPLWIEKSSALHEMERHEEALAAMEQALLLDPDNLDAWYNKGLCLELLERPAHALLAFERCLAGDPNRVYAWYHFAGAFSDLGQHTSAIEALQRAIALDDGYVYGWIDLGLAFLELGRPDEALAAFDAALARDPDEGKERKAHFNRAVALDALGRYEEALQAFDCARKDLSDDAVPHADEFFYTRALTYEHLGQFEAVLEDCRRAVAFDPTYFDAWTLLGWTLTALGREQAALQALDQALALKPQAREPRQKIEHIRRHLHSADASHT